MTGVWCLFGPFRLGRWQQGLRGRVVSAPRRRGEGVWKGAQTSEAFNEDSPLTWLGNRAAKICTQSKEEDTTKLKEEWPD